jgi:geranylgeranyl diphosphate synthase type I
MSRSSQLTAILAKYTPAISESIQQSLIDAPPFLGGMLRYHFGWVDAQFEPVWTDSGKFLRPTLCLLVFEALTGDFRPVLPVAAAIEMIHNFSLIHDDVEDADRERRGRPTVWVVWGQPLAINAGDYLYTLAFKTVNRLDNTHFSGDQIFAVQELIVDSCLDLTLGQDMDLRFEQLQGVSTEMYLEMIDKKTGALLEASVLAGAMLGTSDEEVVKNYRDFAHNIGLAFQIRDDFLGIWGDETQTGKSTDNDLRRKKKTLPVLYTLDTFPSDQLQSLYATEVPLSDPEIEYVRKCLREAEADIFVRQVADTYIERAFDALAKINISNQAHAELETIARFLIERSH